MAGPPDPALDGRATRPTPPAVDGWAIRSLPFRSAFEKLMSPADRSSSILSKLALLSVAAISFILAVAFMGDRRRETNALGEMSVLANRFAAEAAAFDLRNQADVARLVQKVRSESEGGAFEWAQLSDEVVPGGSDDPQLLVWTPVLPRALGEDGRAVVLREGDEFVAKWITRTRFEELRSR